MEGGTIAAGPCALVEATLSADQTTRRDLGGQPLFEWDQPPPAMEQVLNVNSTLGDFEPFEIVVEKPSVVCSKKVY